MSSGSLSPWERVVAGVRGLHETLAPLRRHSVGAGKGRRSTGAPPPSQTQGRAPVKLGVGWKRKWPPETLCPRSGRESIMATNARVGILVPGSFAGTPPTLSEFT